MYTIKGIPASPSIAIGPVYRFRQAVPVSFEEISSLEAEAEQRRFDEAVAKANDQLDCLYEKTIHDAGEAAAQIFDIHKMMLADLDYVESIICRICEEHCTAEQAISSTSEEFAVFFAEMEDETMRARSADVKDICRRMLAILTGQSEEQALLQPSIVGAGDLFPSDTMQLEKDKVLAFITEQGSQASHSAILARTMGIPAVVGAPGLGEALADGVCAIVDGSAGEIIFEPDEQTLEHYRARREAYLAEREKLAVYRDRASVTKDGVAIEVCANIGNPEDALSAARNGADGVGLMRSEFLYMDGEDFPDEETQYQAYSAVLQTMAGKRVVIRTLDIGADKVPRYLTLPHEENPALGCRAIRMCLGHEEMFRTQLRALLRASVHGKLAIMFPMIGKLSELRQAKALLRQCREELAAEGVAVSVDMEVGMMVEVPAAAILSDLFAPEVDFFSIGTNDLTQYTLAADRLNDRTAPLFDYRDEAVLRLIARTARSAREHGIWCGICGESAGDLALLEFYAKAGISELSVVPGRVLDVRKAITEMDVSAL